VVESVPVGVVDVAVVSSVVVVASVVVVVVGLQLQGCVVVAVVVVVVGLQPPQWCFVVVVVGWQSPQWCFVVVAVSSVVVSSVVVGTRPAVCASPACVARFEMPSGNPAIVVPGITLRLSDRIDAGPNPIGASDAAARDGIKPATPKNPVTVTSPRTTAHRLGRDRSADRIETRG
jgi:hypothetical protein